MSSGVQVQQNDFGKIWGQVSFFSGAALLGGVIARLRYEHFSGMIFYAGVLAGVILAIAIIGATWKIGALIYATLLKRATTTSDISWEKVLPVLWILLVFLSVFWAVVGNFVAKACLELFA